MEEADGAAAVAVTGSAGQPRSGVTVTLNPGSTTVTTVARIAPA